MELQVGYTAAETIKSRLRFERAAMIIGVKILSYHNDDEIYHSDEFLKELQAKGQGIKMSGVSDQFQNGAARSKIKSVVQFARIHANLRGSEVVDESLWPYALMYAVYIMPSKKSGVSPMEVWSKSSHHDLPETHSLGYPAYALNPRLREGGHVPKWESRSRRGQFAWHSPLVHASNVGMIRNLNTYHVSPQFHVMHGDCFETVHSNEESPPAPEVWERSYTFNMPQVYWDVKPPKLAVAWLSQGERHARRESELGSHRVLPVPREPTVQREQEGTTEGASPATSQEDIQVPLVGKALAPSPQQSPAQVATSLSEVSPCSVQREQQMGSAERALAQAFSQENLRVPLVEKAAAPSPKRHEAPVVQGLSPMAQVSSNAVDPIRGQSTRSIRDVANQRFLTYKVRANLLSTV